MILAVGLSILCFAAGSQTIQLKRLPTLKVKYSSEHDMPEYSAQERLKRGLPSLIAAIVGKAKPILHYGNYKQFVRFGGYDQAMKDFAELNPTHVEDLQNLIRGKVGDTTVIVNKNGGDPVLTLIKEKSLPGDTVTVQVDAVRYY